MKPTLIQSRYPKFAKVEEDLARNPFDLAELQRVFRIGDLVAVRRLLGSRYEILHGKDHAFVRALQDDPFVNYYRIDSGPAISYLTDWRPLIVFVKRFADGPDPLTGAPVRAEEWFYRYFGCGVETFLRCVRSGRFLPTIGPLAMYEGKDGDVAGPFMRGLLDALHDLPDAQLPAFANLVTHGTKERIGNERSWQLLHGVLQHGSPLLDQPQYALRIDGQPSQLEPVQPRRYLRERLEWFEIVLPPTGWTALQAVWDHFAEEPSEEAFDLMMNATFVFTYLYHAPVNYSRGPSARVSENDVLHWQRVIARATSRVEEGARRAVAARRKADDVQRAVSWIERLDEALRRHVPLVVTGGDEAFEREAPRPWAPELLDATLDAVERRLDRHDAHRQQARLAHDALQKFDYHRLASGDGALSRVRDLAKDLNEELRNLNDAVRARHLAGRSLVRARLGAGASVAGLAGVVADLPARALGAGVKLWGWMDEARVASEEGTVPDANLQVMLDFFQVPGSRFPGA